MASLREEHICFDFTKSICHLSGVHTLGFDYLLLVWVVFSVFAVGVAICARFTPLTGIALLGYGAAMGVAVHGLFGLLIALSWRARHFVAVLPLICAVLAMIDLTRRGVWSKLSGALTRTLRLSLLLWLTFLILCVALVHVEVRWPTTLQEGMFIFQKHRLNTKVQYMTGLPTDNYIPYTVTEYLLRGISFARHRPILPGNEVSNRTILMSLVALPFRTLITSRTHWQHELEKFEFIGREWPDVESLNDDGSFSQFFVIGIFLNSLLLLGLLVFFANWSGSEVLSSAVLVFITNPYFISQTIFIWPKAMAGFFIVLAWNSLRQGHNAIVIGLCAALAYHSHPSSVVAAISLGLWLIYRTRRLQTGWRPAIAYGGVFLIVAVPWLIWTKLVLAFPSDMIWQNFAGPGTEAAMASPVNFIWIRVVNAFNAFAPFALGDYPFSLQKFLSSSAASLPFAVGLLLIIPALRGCEELVGREPAFVCFALALPAAVILLLYSCPAVPILHGWQPIVGVLLFLAVFRIRRTLRLSGFYTVILLQLVMNIGLLWLRGSAAGVHL